MKIMIAPQAGQTFSGLPSGATYKADGNGVVTGVADQDVVAMVKAGCGYDTNAPNTPYYSGTFPHDWTEGSGTLGSGGEIDIPAPAAGTKRIWIFIQNQSAATIIVKYEARLANGTTQQFAPVLLVGNGAGVPGGVEERGFAAFVPQGVVKITGAANAQVTIMEVVE